MSEKKGFSPEEQAELKTALTEVESKMGTKAAEQIEKHLKAAEAKLEEKYATEIGELKQFKAKAETDAVANQKALDELIAKGQRHEVKADTTVSGALGKAMEEKKDALANYTKNRQAISFELKTVGNIGANSNISVSGTPAFYPGGALFEPGRKPYEVSHIRDIVSVRNLPAGMDAFVIRDAGGEGGPTSVAAGSAKPKSDRDWVKTMVPITKIAHHYKVPEEYLADIPWMQSEISGVGVEELMYLEDTKFLTNSAGGEFLGLNQTFNSTAFSAPASLLAAIADANNYDALVAAWTQLRVLKSNATGVLLNPIDYAAMILTKDANGMYVFGAPNQSIPNLFGAPIIPHTTVTSDKYFLGDFTKLVVGQRAGLSVRFYDQNEDDAINNLVTIVIEERITFAADRADRVIYGDFSDNKTSLDTGS